MRVCFIGNSHLSKYYSLLTERGAAEFGDVTPTFFLERSVGTIPLAIQGDTPDDVATIEDVLLTRSRILRCHDFDAFVAIGLGFSLVSLIELWGIYRPTSDATAGAAKHVVSDAFHKAAARSLLRESKAIRVLREIGKRSDKPRILIPQPHPMEWAQEGRTDRTVVFKNISRSGRLEATGELYGNILAEIETTGIKVQHQLPETLASPYYTKSEYGLADPADTKEGSLFSRGDFFHANERFAELTLKSLSKDWLT